MGIDDSVKREVVRRILAIAKPERIILFGSAATGRMSKDSDIDVLVVEREPVNAFEERLRIGDSLSELGTPFDVFIMDAERFEESKAVFGGIAYPAHKYGRVIYPDEAA